VAVDGTIHIGTRYRRARALGENSSEAAVSVLTSVGRALVVTTLALAAGFCVLAPSVMATLANFGLLMSFCLVLALLFDIIMTPAILAWLGPKKSN
jgi:predicted RND superfamily exporter protein